MSSNKIWKKGLVVGITVCILTIGISMIVVGRQVTISDKEQILGHKNNSNYFLLFLEQFPILNRLFQRLGLQ